MIITKSIPVSIITKDKEFCDPVGCTFFEYYKFFEDGERRCSLPNMALKKSVRLKTVSYGPGFLRCKLCLKLFGGG